MFATRSVLLVKAGGTLKKLRRGKASGTKGKAGADREILTTELSRDMGKKKYCGDIKFMLSFSVFHRTLEAWKVLNERSEDCGWGGQTCPAEDNRLRRSCRDSFALIYSFHSGLRYPRGQ